MVWKEFGSSIPLEHPRKVTSTISTLSVYRGGHRAAARGAEASLALGWGGAVEERLKGGEGLG